MKLLVIVLCLLSERFLVHASSHSRFHWFTKYRDRLEHSLPIFDSSGVLLLFLVAPLVVLVGIVLHGIGWFLFGFIGFVLNILIFHQCVGPTNPFYPVRSEIDEKDKKAVGDYLFNVNSQLFGIIFWYCLLGPLAILTYRLVWLVAYQEKPLKVAQALIQVFDWLPARMTGILYLFVGNFHSGFHEYVKFFFANPTQNQLLLSRSGLSALKTDKKQPLHLSQAEELVERALIALLVLIAMVTIVAWLE